MTEESPAVKKARESLERAMEAHAMARDEDDAIKQHFNRMVGQGKDGFSKAFNQYVMRLNETSFQELCDVLDPKNFKKDVDYKTGIFASVFYLSRDFKPKGHSKLSDPKLLTEEINWNLFYEVFFDEGIDLFDEGSGLEEFFASRLNAAKIARKALFDEFEKARKKKIIIGLIVVGLVLFLITNISS